MKTITEKNILNFSIYLTEAEHSALTVQKYLHDVRLFYGWLKCERFEKNDVLRYKQYLTAHYVTASINSMLSSLNSFFAFMGWYEEKVKLIRVQHQIFAPLEKELSKEEYYRLLCAAKRREQLCLLMQTICATGIRVSEVSYITVEAVNRGCAEISLKGKNRRVFLPEDLCNLLKDYSERKGIQDGCIFVTRTGCPLNRSNIWAMMKRLCNAAGVSYEKVFPHNLRHLFARTYYGETKDIIRLSDILGHTSINTTRLYTLESGEVHRQQIQKLGLVKSIT